ncbi:MAG: glycoside hydrolase family 3 C-terminal domain-containing protein [Thermomicrobiales bacterium]
MSLATPHDAEEPTWLALIAQMTPPEKASLLAGVSMWETPPIERLGIPAMRVSDGPNGARGSEGFVGGTVTSAAFPVGIALASTWNVDRIAQIGTALGEEAKTKGARLLLGPTVNIHRSPFNGRNFECYSEDPFLSARMVVGYITGLQQTGVGATVKHFVLNDSEFERSSISVEVDERTLREIYLPPFYAAVREAGTWALMTAYNRIDGIYAGENPYTIRDLLKGEWGFDGLVMSDWFGTHSTIEAIDAGLDLEMPGPPIWRGAKLTAAIEQGHVSSEAVDDAVARVLRTMERTGVFAEPDTDPEQGIDRPEHRALIRQAGAEGIVLLRNDHATLPLDRQRTKKIAVIGPNAKAAQSMGGGSAQVNAHYIVSPWDALTSRLDGEAEFSFAQGAFNHKRLPAIPTALLHGGGFSYAFYGNTELGDEPAGFLNTPASEQIWFAPPVPELGFGPFSARVTTTFTPGESGTHTFSLTSAGLARLFVDGELLIDNWDGYQHGDYFFGMGSAERRAAIDLDAGTAHDLTVEYRSSDVSPLKAIRLGYLPPKDPDAIATAAALAAEADVALVFVGRTGEWDSEGQDLPDDLRLPGEQDALVSAVAAANPNTIVVLQTGTPVTLPWLEEVAAVIQAWYPGQECGNAIVDVLLGDVTPSGKLTQTWPLRKEDNPAFLNYPGERGHVHYGERMFVGYRWYETRDIAPLFPFGFGLSYTAFEYGDLTLDRVTMQPGETVTATIRVTNVGAVAGAEVVQLYVEDVASSLSRPRKELKGFAKVTLQPGESAAVSIPLDRAAFAAWDDGIHQWHAEAGEFTIHAGASSADIRASVRLTLTEDESFLHP